MSLSRVAAVLLLPATAVAPPGKSTIAASDAMHALSFNLKYLPVTVAQDNGAGDEMSHGDLEIQGRVQVLLNSSYTARNCQLYSGKGSLTSASKYESMTSNGLGKDCSYSSGKQYTSGTELHKVFAYNKGQCCNACVATDGCVAASFLTSDNDHSGGFGPQSWEGFGIHITDVDTSKTTGGIPVSELNDHFKNRFGDFSKFDQFMDYSVTFFTYDLQTYADAFKKDGVPFFMAQYQDQDKDTWYSLFFLVNSSHYVIELTSTRKPDVGSATFPQLEQRMSTAHTQKFKSYGDHPAHILWISSINRATSNMTMLDNVYTNMFMAETTHSIHESGVVRRCYNVGAAPKYWCYMKDSADGKVSKKGTTACIPSGSGNCTFTADTDIQNSGGGSYSPVNSKDECCAKCAKDASCKAAAFVAASSSVSFPPSSLDEDICFTQRTASVDYDKTFSVADFEAMLWSAHASTTGNNPSSTVDKYTDNHYAQPMNSVGLSALSTYFAAHDPYPITKDTRLAYACKQNYIIDPTGWSIQPIGMPSWPKC